MFSFFRDPIFVQLMTTGMLYGDVFSTYTITIVDHAVGAAHASNEDGAVLVSAMAIGDFVSRLGTGYLTDRHYITRYFKDKQGSYNGLYYLVAGACAAVVVLWCIIVTASSIKSLFLKRPAHENDLPMPA
ncbi:uncharacterized protein LOC142766967 [Rhipicephalus microplus]|uniref:uncharacterized protein LOC142766967 n=1 Tax=Rhipicephalus microplus TaxID=6941 RepID=UPI003F6BACEB